jgi:RNA polymerase sigma-70 factor (ECF subfamily)
METEATALSLEQLLPHEDFVRKLARRLVEDAAAADDVVQEAMLLAWRRPPRDAVALRGWFRTVVRRLVSRRRQQESSRRAREESAASEEHFAPSPAEILGREEQRRLVLEQVLALPKRSREVLLLRYHEGLSPSEIGRRLSRPAGTVRSQLHRSLEELRTRLDHKHGGERREWALALIPLSIPRLAKTAALGGTAAGVGTWLGVLMLKKSLIALSAVLLVSGWFVLDAFDAKDPLPPDPQQAAAPVVQMPAAKPAAHDSREGSAAAAPERQPVAHSGAVQATTRQQIQIVDALGQAASHRAFGCLRDEFPRAREGWAIESHRHLVQATPSAARTDAQGRIELEPKRTGELLWVEIRAGQWALFDLASLESLDAARKKDDASRIEESRAGLLTLRLPADTVHRVSIPGIGAHETWKAWLQPAMRDPEDMSWLIGNLYRRVPSRTGEAKIMVLAVSVSEQRGPGPVELKAPAGMPFNVDIRVDRRVAQESGQRGEEQFRVGPANWSFLTGGLLPRVEIEFVDQEGERVAPRSGAWSVLRERGYIDHDSFEEQNPLVLPFQVFDDERDYALQVVTNQGEVQGWQLRFDKERSDQKLRMICRPMPKLRRLRVPAELLGSPKLRLYVEHQDGAARYATNYRRNAPQIVMEERRRFLPPQTAFLQSGEELLYFADPKQKLRALWLHDDSGRVARCSAQDAAFTLLETTEPLDIDLRSIYRRNGILETTSAHVIVELRSGVQLVIASRELHPERQASFAPLQLQLPTRAKASLELYVFGQGADRRRIRVPLRR